MFNGIVYLLYREDASCPRDKDLTCKIHTSQSQISTAIQFLCGAKSLKLKKLLIAFLVLVGISCNDPSSENTLNGKVVGIIDGDTFEMLVDEKPVRVRLHAIDCPERTQHYYQQSKDGLSGIIFSKKVRVEVTGKDRFNRIIGDVYLNSDFVNAMMIERGLAWHFTRYSDDPKLSALEAQARERGVGLWSLPDPVAPWEFRDPDRKVADDGQ